MTVYRQFTDFLQEYIEFYEQVESAAQEKLRVVLSYNLANLEKMINGDEAVIMRARQYERRRLEIQAEIGYANLSLRDIIQKMPEQESAELNVMYNRLSTLLESIRFYNKRTADIINDNLYVINKAREQSKPAVEATVRIDEKA